MQAFALLSLEFQVARQRLGKTLAASRAGAEARNLNSPGNVGTSCCTPIEPLLSPPAPGISASQPISQDWGKRSRPELMKMSTNIKQLFYGAKFRILVMAMAGLGLAYTAFAADYKYLAGEGYRWVTVNGPYACSTEQFLRRQEPCLTRQG